MNRINFEQQNQMFDKQAEWNSAEQQKQRLKEAGLNPALMYGIGGEGGSSTSSGGGAGAQVAGGLLHCKCKTCFSSCSCINMFQFHVFPFYKRGDGLHPCIPYACT